MSLRGIGVLFDIIDFERFGSAFSRYKELDREGPFWREEAGKKAAKKDLDVPTAFAGLLVFDVLGATAVRRMFSDTGATSEARVPFDKARALLGRRCLFLASNEYVPRLGGKGYART